MQSPDTRMASTLAWRLQLSFSPAVGRACWMWPRDDKSHFDTDCFKLLLARWRFLLQPVHAALGAVPNATIKPRKVTALKTKEDKLMMGCHSFIWKRKKKKTGPSQNAAKLEISGIAVQTQFYVCNISQEFRWALSFIRPCSISINQALVAVSV